MTLGSMDHGEGSAAQLVQLEPLIHQVSGHSSLWVLDDVTVCKPLIGREAKFYRTLPAQMRNFTPEFRGTLKVLVQRTAEGVAVAALPPGLGDQRPSFTPTISTLKHHNSMKVRRVPSRTVEVESEEGKGGVATPLSPSPPCLPPTHNPWLQQCHQRYLSKFKVEANATVMECILLENLTHVYRVPNVLDLKMGTRQYGDDAPESKRRSQTRKAQHTTTPRLGVRLAGMQVFNRDTKCYVCKNKYVGRGLSEDGFQQTLRHFLHNGRRFRADILDQIICKLTDLRTVVGGLDSFRFFTSSLLILYDSYDARGNSRPIDPSADNLKYTNPEKRNKSRERCERRLELTPNRKSGSEGYLTQHNKGVLDSDISDREPSKSVISCNDSTKSCLGSSGSRSNSESFSTKFDDPLSVEDHVNTNENISQCGPHPHRPITFGATNSLNLPGNTVPNDPTLQSVSKQRACRNSKEKSTAQQQHYQQQHLPQQQNLLSRLSSLPQQNFVDPQSCEAGVSLLRGIPLSSDLNSLNDTNTNNTSSNTSELHTNSLTGDRTDVSNSNGSRISNINGGTCNSSSSCSSSCSSACHSNVCHTQTSSFQHSSSSETSSSTTTMSTTTATTATSTTVPTFRTKVDIRLIDFAHATHKGMGDPTIYSGPDEGMMLGLKSLINIFTDIRDLYSK